MKAVNFAGYCIISAGLLFFLFALAFSSPGLGLIVAAAAAGIGLTVLAAAYRSLTARLDRMEEKLDRLLGDKPEQKPDEDL